MTVKEWLQRIGKIERQIYSLEDSASRAFESATNTGSRIVLSGQGGFSGKRISRVEESLVIKISLEQAISEKLEELRQLRRAVMTVLSQVDDIDKRDILEMHYVTGWTLVYIADEVMKCTVRWVQIQHGNALQDVAGILRGLPEITEHYQIDL